jgi:hypothetical protein
MDWMRQIHANTDMNWEDFLKNEGDEHYKLLAFLSTLFKGRDIIDIGTYKGASALAPSYTPENTVYSFDSIRSFRLPSAHNIQYVLRDLWDPLVRSVHEERLLGSAFIFLDIAPHAGSQEFEFYQWLKAKKYKGFIIFDDIFHFQGMWDTLWTKIPNNEKLDLTHLGHWSGTGLIHFASSELDMGLALTIGPGS